STNSHLADKADLVCGSISASDFVRPQPQRLTDARGNGPPIACHHGDGLDAARTQGSKGASRRFAQFVRDTDGAENARFTPQIDDGLGAILKRTKAVLIEKRSHHLRHSTVPSPNRT